MVEIKRRIPGARKVALCGISVALAATMCVPGAAFAQPTSADKLAEAQAALATLNTMRQQADEASANYGRALEQQAEAEAAHQDCLDRIDDANEEISAIQGKLSSRAHSMYKEGSASILDLLLGASTWEEFANNWDLLMSINQDDSEMVNQTKELRAEIEAQEAEAARQEQIATENANAAAQAEADARSAEATMQQTYDGLSAEAAELLAQEEAAQAAAEAAAAASVVEASAQEAAAAQAAGNSGNSGNGGSNGGGTVDNGGSAGGAVDNGSGTVDNGGGTANNGGGESYVEETTPSQPSYSASTGNAIVDRAYSQMGKPYVWGGVGPDGFDCSGLVGYALTGSYSRVGTTYTYMAWPQVSDPQPGDICTSSYHCGIYIGDGQMIHAPQTGDVVKVAPVQGDMIIVRCPW